MLFVDPELADNLKGIEAEHTYVIGSDDDLMVAGDPDPLPWEPDENATATINYTSGTTARPKGVQMTHRNIWVDATTFGWHTGVSDRDVYLHTLPMFHCNGWGMPFTMAAMGVPQVVLRKVDGMEILRRVERHGVTIMCAAPAVVAAVLDAAPHWDGEIPGRGRVRIVVAGAPPPTRTIVRVEEELGWEFIQIYGLTETSPLLTINRSRQEWDDLSAEERPPSWSAPGRPRSAYASSRRRGRGAGALQRGARGLLEATRRRPSAASRAAGSTPATAASSATTATSPSRTARRTSSSPAARTCPRSRSRTRIFSHPDVAEVAVIGVPDEKWGETIKALVVKAEGSSLTEQELIDYVKGKVARYKAPSSVEFREVLDRTATGKLQKFKLRAPYWEGRDRQVN